MPTTVRDKDLEIRIAGDTRLLANDECENAENASSWLVTSNTTEILWPGWVNSAQAAYTNNGGAATWNYWTIHGTGYVTTGGGTAAIYQTWVTNPQHTRIEAGMTAAERQAAYERDMAERRARDEAYRLARELDRKQSEEARQRANQLLLANLSPEQRKEYIENGRFHIDLNGKRFLVDYGSHNNVHLLDEEGKIAESYCIQPNAPCPEPDAMLAQKLVLEADMKHFMQVANATKYPKERRHVPSSHGRRPLLVQQ